LLKDTSRYHWHKHVRIKGWYDFSISKLIKIFQPDLGHVWRSVHLISK